MKAFRDNPVFKPEEHWKFRCFGCQKIMTTHSFNYFKAYKEYKKRGWVFDESGRGIGKSFCPICWEREKMKC